MRPRKKRICDYARAICRRHSIRAKPWTIIVSCYTEDTYILLRGSFYIIRTYLYVLFSSLYEVFYDGRPPVGVTTFAKGCWQQVDPKSLQPGLRLDV